MSVDMEEEVKRWTARRKSALVLEIIQGPHQALGMKTHAMAYALAA